MQKTQLVRERQRDLGRGETEGRGHSGARTWSCVCTWGDNTRYVIQLAQSSWHRLIVKCAAWNHPRTDVNEGALDRRGCAAVCSEGQCEAPAPAVGA